MRPDSYRNCLAEGFFIILFLLSHWRILGTWCEILVVKLVCIGNVY